MYVGATGIVSRPVLGVERLLAIFFVRTYVATLV
jgi:hypothetical protein